MDKLEFNYIARRGESKWKTGLHWIKLIQILILSANTAIGRRRTAICLKVKIGAYSSDNG